MSRLAVFAYGSLVSAASASQTLGRRVEGAPEASLIGWRRDWSLARDNNASEKTFALPDGTLPRFCLGLNLVPDSSASPPNGVLLELDEAELERLDRREIRYRRVDVTAQIHTDGAASGRFDSVVAYCGRPEHHHPIPPAGAVIIASYPRAIEAAFAARGPDALDAYRATTAPPPVEVVEAELVFDRVPAGNPRRW